MFLTYNQWSESEGVGAQYQRIICMLAIAKYHNLKYIHTPIKIGHNYNNDDNWSQKWDNMFNIIKLSNNNDVDIDKLDKVYNHKLDCKIINNIVTTTNILYYLHDPYELYDTNTNSYLSSIQNSIIETYDEINNSRTLIYNKNKINIAIHIRVYNDYDNNGEYSNYINNISCRFIFTCDKYEKLINELKDKYLDADIHIFSQVKYFDLKYKKLRDISNLIFHFDDLDNFDTFHHLCKADVLVLGTSSFSMLAGFYNKNTVIYLPYISPPSLNSWIIYK